MRTDFDKEREYNTAYTYYRRTGNEEKLNAVMEKYGMSKKNRGVYEFPAAKNIGKKYENRNNEIRKMRGKGMLHREIAEKYGLSKARIAQICGPTGYIQDVAVGRENLSIRLNNELIVKIRKRAKTERLTVSALARKIFWNYLSDNN